MMRIVVFTESSPQNAEDSTEQALRRFADSATQAGHYIIGLPENWSEMLPEIVESVPHGIARGLYSGFYRPGDEYQRLYETALARGIILPNTPEESKRAMDLTSWINPLEELSARSWIVENERHLEDVLPELPWPVFVKGTIKSRKEEGWDACVAADESQLREQWERIQRSGLQEALVVRELLPLRQSGSIKGFPCGREYRLLLWQGKVVACNYYWGAEDPFGEEDHEPLHELALKAQRRLDVPLLAVDLGQLEDGSWKLIEVGDPQYTLYSFTTYPAFWQQFTG